MRVIEGLPAGSVLGLNYSGLHDSAITVVGPDGSLQFACALERVTRRKQDGRWPQPLLDLVPWDRIAAVAVPSLPHDAAVQLGQRHAVDGWPLPVEGGALAVTPPGADLARRLQTLPVPVLRFDHHHAHAASAWFLAGQQRGLVLTCDGGAASCPWTATAWRGDGDRLELVGGMAHGAYWSPTVAYTMVTALLGLRPNLHEGKVTGLAARGRATPALLDEFRRLVTPLLPLSDHLVHWAHAERDDRPARLVVNPHVRQAWRAQFAAFTDADLAACVQKLAETDALAMLERGLELAGRDRPELCLAGGLFANVRINQLLIGHGFRSGFVAPPMTDDGVALGAALLGWRQLHPDGARAAARTTMFLGPDLGAAEADAAVTAHGLQATSPPDLAAAVAAHLLAGRTVAVARGRMEFGPRALGNRSILSRTADAGINDALNGKLRRTEYMPFAPVLQAADADAHLLGVPAIASAARFMTVTADCRPATAASCPAVVHVDGTARPQLVSPDDAPFLDQVIAAFRAGGGEPAILNTSFNIHEEPIVCSADDALMGFATAALDVLVLGERMIEREPNAVALDRIAARHEPPPRFGATELVEVLGEWSQQLAERLTATTRTVTALTNTPLPASPSPVPPPVPVPVPPPPVEPERLEQLEHELALARLEVQSYARELQRVRDARLLRLARAFDRARGAVARGSLGAARTVATGIYRRLPAGWRAALARRIAEGTLPWPLQGLVRRLEPRAGIGMAASPFDKIDHLFTRQPRVSVVIPCFDQGELLLETLASLQRQTFPFFEVVVVDDGSTDTVTRAVLEDLHWPGLDLHVLRQANAGPARARNAGIAAARADLILPLDADDLLEPDCLMQMVSLLDQRPDLGIAYCDIRFFGARDEVVACPEYDLEALLEENFMVVTSLFRKALWQSVGGYNEELVHGYEDWCLWIDFAAIGWYGKRIPAPLFRYRIKEQSRNVTAVANNKVLIAQIRKRHEALYADTALRELWRRHAVWDDPRPVAPPDRAAAPLVTVLIPCFNYGRYLEDAIRSALAQTHPAVEILVLDDGSTDPATVELLRTRQWPRTRVVRHDNMGLAATRNRGFELAQGDYVVPLDADDMLLPTMVATCLRALQQDRSAGWAYTDIRFFDHENAVHRQEDYNLALELTNNHSSVCAMIRKAAWRDAGGYNPNMRKGYEDWDFWVSCSQRGWHGKLVDGALFAYRLHGVSMVTESKKHHQHLVNTIRRNHPLLYLPWNVEAIRNRWLRDLRDRRQLPAVTSAVPAAPLVRTPGAPLFTVVVPVFRHHAWLRQCIDSVLQQGCQDFELVLVDDDPANAAITAVLAAYAADPRVRILVNDRNRGIACTLNRGIVAGRGDYVAFLDCDDFLVPTALAELSAWLQSGPVRHYVSTQILDVDEHGEVVRRRPRAETPQDLHRGMFAGHLKVVKRSAFAQVGLLDEDMSGCQDYEFVLRLHETWPVDFLQSYLYCYRWHGGTVSVTQQQQQQALADRIVNATRYRRWLQDDTAAKGDYERVCVLVLGGGDAVAMLPTLRASTGLPLVVALETAPGQCELHGSDRRDDPLRRLATGVAAEPAALAAAGNARFLVCLRPGMQVPARWLEQLYFLLTSKVGQGAAPRLLDGSRGTVAAAGLEARDGDWQPVGAGSAPDDLETMRVRRCAGIPLFGSLFPVEHLQARLPAGTRLHAGLADTVVAAAATADDRYYLAPTVTVVLGAAAAQAVPRAAAS